MMFKAIALVTITECAQAPMPPPRQPPPLAPQACTSHRVHGTVVDGDGKPVGKTQVSLVGGAGQDDATTDDDGHFDVTATTPTRDQLVVFYGDTNVTRKLDAKLCDEVIDLRIAVPSRAPLTM
jgi:hypothetical protein